MSDWLISGLTVCFIAWQHSCLTAWRSNSLASWQLNSMPVWMQPWQHDSQLHDWTTARLYGCLILPDGLYFFDRLTASLMSWHTAWMSDWRHTSLTAWLLAVWLSRQGKTDSLREFWWSTRSYFWHMSIMLLDFGHRAVSLHSGHCFLFIYN